MKRVLPLFIVLFIVLGISPFAGAWNVVGWDRFSLTPLTANLDAGGYDITNIGDMSLAAQKHLVLPQHDDAATPTLSFGDGDTGWYERGDDQLTCAINGAYIFRIINDKMNDSNGVGFQLNFGASSATEPSWSFNTDENTGLGRAAADTPAIISGGVPSQVWGTTVTLSTAQINALQGTPIAVVAAQGANTNIELVSVMLTYDYATAAFTVAADEDLVIEYADGTDATASIETAGFLDQPDDEVRYYPTVLAAAADLEASINQGLQIKNTGAGETADGGGELDVRIVYRVYATGF